MPKACLSLSSTNSLLLTCACVLSRITHATTTTTTKQPTHTSDHNKPLTNLKYRLHTHTHACTYTHTHSSKKDTPDSRREKSHRRIDNTHIHLHPYTFSSKYTSLKQSPRNPKKSPAIYSVPTHSVPLISARLGGGNFIENMGDDSQDSDHEWLRCWNCDGPVRMHWYTYECVLCLTVVAQCTRT